VTVEIGAFGQREPCIERVATRFDVAARLSRGSWKPQ